jgi:dephospho-CoA kinase
MYTEILKIIEGGLSKDMKKVYSYSKLLAEKLGEDGDIKMSQSIIKLIENNMKSAASLDQLATAPVDQESRLSILDIYRPGNEETIIVLSDHIKSRIDDFVNSIKHQRRLKGMGIESPNTLLLYGPPGCGKSTLAKSISEKTGLPLVTARLDAIVSSLLGNTAKNIRKIFEYADSKPCILFLDEFDAIAKARDDQYELGELKRVINSLLQNIDQFAQNNILIAATNHQELLDKAIWRRFNTVIKIDRLHDGELERLIKIFLQGVPNDFEDDEKKFERLTKLMHERSPSDIKSIIHNSIAQYVIKGHELLNYEDLLIEIYEFEHHGIATVEELVSYLNDQGVAQAAISEKLSISLRQVRNVLTKES